MNSLSFEINNQRILKLAKRRHDGAAHIVIENQNGEHEPISDGEATIAPGDFVQLINYYRYIKSNDIHDDFINPNGKNTEV